MKYEEWGNNALVGALSHWAEEYGKRRTEKGKREALGELVRARKAAKARMQEELPCC